jgi:hypothetical protein
MARTAWTNVPCGAMLCLLCVHCGTLKSYVSAPSRRFLSATAIHQAAPSALRRGTELSLPRIPPDHRGIWLWLRPPMRIRGGKEQGVRRIKPSKRRREQSRAIAPAGSLKDEMDAAMRKKAVRQHWTPSGVSKHRDRQRSTGGKPRMNAELGSEEDDANAKDTNEGGKRRKKREPEPWEVMDCPLLPKSAHYLART